MGALSSACFSAALPGPGVPSGIAGRDEEGKKIKFSTSCHQLLCSTLRLLWDPFSFSTDVLREWGWGLEGRKGRFYSAWWDTVTQEAPRPSVKLLFTAALGLVRNLVCKLLEEALICCTQLSLLPRKPLASNYKNSFGRRVWHGAKSFFSTKVIWRTCEMQK